MKCIFLWIQNIKKYQQIVDVVSSIDNFGTEALGFLLKIYLQLEYQRYQH